MSISSPEQFEKLRACGMIVGKALRAMAAAVRPAITTAELCEIGSRVLAKHGARSSPPMVYGFPGDVCRSEEHTSELQSRLHLVCRLLLEKKKQLYINDMHT